VFDVSLALKAMGRAIDSGLNQALKGIQLGFIKKVIFCINAST